MGWGKDQQYISNKNVLVKESQSNIVYDDKRWKDASQLYFVVVWKVKEGFCPNIRVEKIKLSDNNLTIFLWPIFAAEMLQNVCETCKMFG